MDADPELWRARGRAFASMLPIIVAGLILLYKALGRREEPEDEEEEKEELPI